MVDLTENGNRNGLDYLVSVGVEAAVDEMERHILSLAKGGTWNPWTAPQVRVIVTRSGLDGEPYAFFPEEEDPDVEDAVEHGEEILGIVVFEEVCPKCGRPLPGDPAAGLEALFG